MLLAMRICNKDLYIFYVKMFLFSQKLTSDLNIVFLVGKCLRCCFHGSGSSFFGVLALLFAESSQTSLGTTVEDSLAVLVHLQFHNKQLRWMNADIDVGAVCFLALYSLNVDHEFLTVDLDNLAYLISLVVSTNHLK